MEPLSNEGFPSAGRTILIVGTLAIAGLAFLSLLMGWILPPFQLAVYATLMLFPGLIIHGFLDRKVRWLDILLFSLIISPVVTTSAMTLIMLAGLSAQTSANSLVIAFIILAVVAIPLKRNCYPDSRLSVKAGLLLASAIVLFCLLAGYLPLTQEAWRHRSDAWYHIALVAQIDAYGLPPEDPYVAGFTVQYMWFYHVLVLALSRATGIAPALIMPLVNLHGLVGFCLAAYELSCFFKKRFAYGFLALLVVVLGVNAVVWFFLPLKLIRAFIGDVRGWEEVVRNFRLVPFERATVMQFLQFLNTPVFLLNKFIVSTPFSLGLSMFAACWYACVKFLGKDRPTTIVLLIFSFIGMLTFHPILGLIMGPVVFGGLLVLYIVRHRLEDFSFRRPLAIGAIYAVVLLLVAPYLYSIMQYKESKQLVPLSISVWSSAAMFSTSFLVIILASFQIRRQYSHRTMSSYWFLCSTVIIFVLCNMIGLPGPNTFDKLTVLSFYPIAVIGSWTFGDLLVRRCASSRFKRKIVVLFMLLFLPVNVLALSAYYNTRLEPFITPDEEAVSAWVRENTQRKAILQDSRERVVLQVTGPRRSYLGRVAYVNLLGYPAAEIELRKHVRENLYSTDPLEQKTLAVLGSITSDIYLIARDDDERTALERFTLYPDLFQLEFRSGTLSVLKVNREASLRTARSMELDQQ
jgi:hypothetical protein